MELELEYAISFATNLGWSRTRALHLHLVC